MEMEIRPTKRSINPQDNSTECEWQVGAHLSLCVRWTSHSVGPSASPRLQGNKLRHTSAPSCVAIASQLVEGLVSICSSLFLLLANPARWCFWSRWEYLEAVGISDPHTAKPSLPSESQAECLLLAHGVLCSHPGSSLWQMSADEHSYKSLWNAFFYTPCQLARCFLVLSGFPLNEVGNKASYLLSKFFSVWNGEQWQPLPCQRFPSVQLKRPVPCTLNDRHSEGSRTWAFMTGEKSLITLGCWWKVLSFIAFSWIMRKLTAFCELLAQCHISIQRKNFPWLTKRPLWVSEILWVLILMN